MNVDLWTTFSIYIKKIYIKKVDIKAETNETSLEAFLAFRLIPLDKNPAKDFGKKKQPSDGDLRKTCPENTHHIYRRTPMPKCDTSVCVFSNKFFVYFQKTFS